MKRCLRSLIPACILILLLARPSLSFEGARNGLLLWFNVVFPTLFPFMVFSSLLVARGGIPLLLAPLSSVLKWLHLSQNGGYSLLTGLLCGYPMGAKNTADFMAKGQISPAEGKALMAIVSNPSPMFLAGYVYARMPRETIPFYMILLSVYLPLLPLFFLARRLYRHPETSFRQTTVLLPSHHTFPTDRSHRSELPHKTKEHVRFSNLPEKGLDCLILDNLEILVRIGGYIMLYSILAAWIRQLLPDPLAPLFMGLSEMTTGIQAISETIPGTAGAIAILVCAVFGGLSGISQTKTVLDCAFRQREKNAGLSIRHYIFWKLIHASLASAIFILLSLL